MQKKYLDRKKQYVKSVSLTMMCLLGFVGYNAVSVYATPPTFENRLAYVDKTTWERVVLSNGTWYIANSDGTPSTATVTPANVTTGMSSVPVGVNGPVGTLPDMHYVSVAGNDSASPSGTNWNNDGATGTNSIAIGRSASSSGGNSVAIGQNANTSGSSSVALGDRTQTTLGTTTVIGSISSATSTGSLGYGSDVLLGYQNTLVDASRISIIGSQNSVTGNTSVNNANKSTVIGAGNAINTDTANTLKYFKSSAVIGADNTNVNQIESTYILGNGNTVAGSGTETVNFSTTSSKLRDSFVIGNGNIVNDARAVSTIGGLNRVNNSYSSALTGINNRLTNANASSIIGINNQIVLTNAPGTDFLGAPTNDVQDNIIGYENSITGASKKNSIIGSNNSLTGTSTTNSVFGFSNTIGANLTSSQILANSGTVAAGVDNGILIGTSGILSSDQAIAMGYKANIGTEAIDGIAIGSNAKVSVLAGVAIGSGSVADRAAFSTDVIAPFSGATLNSYNTLGALSVGSGDYLRQIVNLGDGTEPTDAVNLRQLRSGLSFGVRSGGSSIGNLTIMNSSPVFEAGAGLKAVITGTDTIVFSIDTDSDIYKNLKGDKGDTGDTGPAGATGPQGETGPAGQDGGPGSLDFSADSGDTITRDANEELKIKGGATDIASDNNIGVVSDGNDTLSIKLAKDITGIDSLSVNESINVAGSTSISATGISTNGIQVAVGSSAVTIDNDGISMGNNQIHDVAAGTAGTDAVNVNQLQAVDGRVDNINNSVINLSNNINRLDDRVNRVGAGAAALAALHPLDFDPDNKWDFAVGYGNFKGSNAVAVGTYFRPNEDTMISVGGSFNGGENMINAGVSFKLGGGNHVSTSRVAMAKEIKDLRKEIETMKAAIIDSSMGRKLDTSRLQLFPDVPNNHWAYEYVAVLAGNGLVEGYPDGNFGGDRPMTRYEFATILYRAMLKGATLSNKILQEFAPELERFTVDTISADKTGKPIIERVRVKK